MGDMLRSNRYDASFEIIGEEYKLIKCLQLEKMELLSEQRKKGTKEEKVAYITILSWIDPIIFLQVVGCPLSLAVCLYASVIFCHGFLQIV